MTRRILALITRDMTSGLRDSLIIWGLVTPFLLALAVRAFIPAVQGAAINLVVTPDLGDELIARLNDYAVVEVVPDRREVERRVLRLDDAAGIVREGDGYRVVVEGNEREETAVLPRMVLADILAPPVVEVVQADLGRAASLVKPFWAIFLALTSLIIGGMVIGFSIIEERESNTIAALAVSPLSRFEYIAGRSILGLGLSVLLVLGVVYLMGAAPFDPAKVLVVSLAASLSAVIFGLYVGSVSGNQIEGIGALKIGAIPFSIVPLFSLIIPEGFQVALYWLPTYWTFLGYRAIFIDAAGWPELLRLVAINLGVSLLFVAGSWGLLRNRLSLRG